MKTRPKTISVDFSQSDGARSTSAVVTKCVGDEPPRTANDLVTAEEPMEIRVRGRSIAVTMRTPGNDRELAAGFLLSEGVIEHRDEITDIAPCTRGENAQNILNVFVAPSVKIDFNQLTRHVFASSSCGLCGKASIDSVHQRFPPISSGAATTTRRTLYKLPNLLLSAQDTFNQTGGLHAAALFTSRGRLVALREDVGRHNAVDKVIGFAFLNGLLPLDRHILLVSGRASFEIMQKALAARIAIVAAVSAPSSLAVEFAGESRQTLIGFLRGERMNIYSHPDRIIK